MVDMRDIPNLNEYLSAEEIQRLKSHIYTFYIWS